MFLSGRNRLFQFLISNLNTLARRGKSIPATHWTLFDKIHHKLLCSRTQKQLMAILQKDKRWRSKCITLLSVEVLTLALSSSLLITGDSYRGPPVGRPCW